MEQGGHGDLIELPAGDGTAQQIALDELDLVYAFIYARVGNRPDAEDLTQQVAMKAIPRLRAEAAAPSVRAYLFATARTVLASFWARKFGLGEEELHDELALPAAPAPAAAFRARAGGPRGAAPRPRPAPPPLGAGGRTGRNGGRGHRRRGQPPAGAAAGGTARGLALDLSGRALV